MRRLPVGFFVIYTLWRTERYRVRRIYA